MGYHYFWKHPYLLKFGTHLECLNGTWDPTISNPFWSFFAPWQASIPWDSNHQFLIPSFFGNIIFPHHQTCQMYMGKSTLKIDRYCPLGDVGFLLFFRFVSGDLFFPNIFGFHHHYVNGILLDFFFPTTWRQQIISYSSNGTLGAGRQAGRSKWTVQNIRTGDAEIPEIPEIVGQWVVKLEVNSSTLNFYIRIQGQSGKGRD